jgi:hypothetical protein
MKFGITRTSDVCMGDKPCIEATEYQFQINETKGTEILKILQSSPLWEVEISNFDELLDFCEKYKSVIIKCTENGFELEIYDESRE